MRLEPDSQLILVRGLEDHTDSTTYYVQAVIRDSLTDALIDTVNLVDKGNRRFSKSWHVPPDPTGQGRDILITFTVYTDSGYSSKATTYGEKFDDHRIEHAPKNGGGGGGVDIDYKKIQKMVDGAVANIPKTKPVPTKEPNLTPISDSLQAILSEIRGIDIPKPDKLNLTPLMGKFDALEASLKAAIDGKEMPETDLSGIEQALHVQGSKLDQVQLDAVKQQVEGLFSRIKQFFGTDIDEIKTEIASLKTNLDNIDYLVLRRGSDKINNASK